jgi:beta-lactamase superfamily II metal-dependent hydrolase
MSVDVLRISCLPAGHGDCVLVEYGLPGDRTRVLLDAGPANAYTSVRAALARLKPDQRRFARLIVSHVDTDHIDGAILLLQDDKLGLKFDEVWFNGWPQLARLDGEPPDVFAPTQGEFVGALLTERGIPWNASLATPGGPLVVTDPDDPPQVPLPGGASLTLLSPHLKKLRRLRKLWPKALADAGMAPGDWQAARERLDKRAAYQPPDTEPDVFAPKSFGSDAAVANGSSIAFLLEYRARRVLLCADAYAPVLTAGLHGVAKALGVARVPLDAATVPHHGSVANIEPALLDAIDCPRFLVSTDGAYHGLPDVATIELIGERAPGGEVRFNYRSAVTEQWDGAGAVAAGITAVFPPDSAVLELDADGP